MSYQYNCNEIYDYFKKAREKEKLSKDIADTTALVEMAPTSSFINFAGKYMWVVMSNLNLNTAQKLGVTSIKKY